MQCCRGGNGNPLGSQLSALGLIGARTPGHASTLHQLLTPSTGSSGPFGAGVLYVYFMFSSKFIYFRQCAFMQKLPCLTLRWPKWEQLTSNS